MRLKANIYFMVPNETEVNLYLALITLWPVVQIHMLPPFGLNNHNITLYDSFYCWTGVHFRIPQVMQHIFLVDEQFVILLLLTTCN